MENFKVIGIEKKSGTYEGHPYENIVLHVVSSDPANIAGEKTRVFKFKARQQDEILHGVSLNSLLGKTINVYFNAFQQIVSVNVVK